MVSGPQDSCPCRWHHAAQTRGCSSGAGKVEARTLGMQVQPFKNGLYFLLVSPVFGQNEQKIKAIFKFRRFWQNCRMAFAAVHQGGRQLTVQDPNGKLDPRLRAAADLVHHENCHLRSLQPLTRWVTMCSTEPSQREVEKFKNICTFFASITPKLKTVKICILFVF